MIVKHRPRPPVERTAEETPRNRTHRGGSRQISERSTPDACPPAGPVRRGVTATVIDCYEFLDRLFPECGLLDLTEGMYHGDSSVSYEEAQQNQIQWLLDQVGCRAGSRILDIGCGNGTLLDAAQRRGADAVGITVCPAQVARCRQSGLDARLLDYRDITPAWDGRFDAVVANGSIEHFVQPHDAVLGWQDIIYRELFQLCHRVLDGRSPSGRMATTVIHFDRFRPDPRDLRRNPLVFRPFSDRFQVAVLERAMGGYYPHDDQLARCAAPYFELVEEVDGTRDYRWTSEEWLRRIRATLGYWRTMPRLCRRLLPHGLRHPWHALASLSMVVTESWQWQFRGNPPPMRLLRQVWQGSQPRHRKVNRTVSGAHQPGDQAGG